MPLPWHLLLALPLGSGQVTVERSRHNFLNRGDTFIRSLTHSLTREYIGGEGKHRPRGVKRKKKTTFVLIYYIFVVYLCCQ